MGDDFFAGIREPMGRPECFDLIRRALVILDQMAGEGIFFPGVEDPADLVMEVFNRLGADGIESAVAELRAQAEATTPEAPDAE